jgi:peptide/nickel transport system substrate-binding protein
MKRSLTTTIAIFCCLFIISCGGQRPSDENTLTSFTYNEPDGIASVDPAVASYQAAAWANTHLFNGLVELDTNLGIAPCIASSWEVDPSGRTWTFHLRTDIWFHTDACFGPDSTRRVTAEDVRYSIERICDARTKSTGLWAFRTRIDGADGFHQATRAGQRGHISGIRVINDSTISVTLTEPFAPFLAVLTMPYGSIVPKEAVERYGADFGQHPVGTGPFRFASWMPDVELTLTRNERYFKVDTRGTRMPYLTSVHITFLRDVKNEFLEFTRGRYDVVTSVDGSFAPSVYDVTGRLIPPYTRFNIHRAAAHSIEYYGILLDTTYPAAKSVPLASQRLLRQALNYAIDRHRIVTYVLHGRGIPAHHGVLPPTMPGFADSVNGYRYDIDRARDLLASAGFPNGNGCPPLLLQLGNNPRTASVAEAIQEMWREIGITVELRQVDFPQHLSQVRSGELAMWRTSWMGDYPDPENFLALFTTQNLSPSGPNTTHIRRADLDDLYARALSPALTFEERASLYHQMERIVLEESPWIFLYHDVLIRLTQPNVKGFLLDGSGRLLLERVYKTPPTNHLSN